MTTYIRSPSAPRVGRAHRPPVAAALARLESAPGAPRVQVGALGGCRPPGSARPHAHEYWLLAYSDAGGGWHELGSAREEVRAGELIAVPPGTPHDFGGGEATVALAFMPDAASPGPRARSLAGRGARWSAATGGEPRAGARHALAPHEGARLRGLLADVGDELRQRRLGFQAAVRAQLDLVLVLLARLADAPGAACAPQDPVVDEVLELIEARFREHLSLEGVAAAVARSTRHLSRTVRELTGESVMQLVEDRRMDEARRLLLETGDNVDAIGCAVGYGDGAYFARRFRRVHGMPPSAWRRLNR